MYINSHKEWAMCQAQGEQEEDEDEEALPK